MLPVRLLSKPSDRRTLIVCRFVFPGQGFYKRKSAFQCSSASNPLSSLSVIGHPQSGLLACL